MVDLNRDKDQPGRRGWSDDGDKASANNDGEANVITVTYTGGMTLCLTLPSGTVLVDPGSTLQVDKDTAKALTGRSDFSAKRARSASKEIAE